MFQWRWLVIPRFVHRESTVIGSCSVEKHSRSQTHCTFHPIRATVPPHHSIHDLAQRWHDTRSRSEAIDNALSLSWLMSRGGYVNNNNNNKKQQEAQQAQQAQAHAVNHNTIWSTFMSTPSRHLEGERPSARFRTEKCPSSSFLQEWEKSHVQWKLGPKPKPELNHVSYHLNFSIESWSYGRTGKVPGNSLSSPPHWALLPGATAFVGTSHQAALMV